MKTLRLSQVLAVLAIVFSACEATAARPGAGGGRPGGGARPGAGPAPSVRGNTPGPASVKGPGGLPGKTPQVKPGANLPKQPPGVRNPGSVGEFQDFFDGTRGRTATGDAKTNAQNRRTAAYQWNSNRPEPFTAAWYADHPNAWKVTHPHADAFVAAGATALAAWLAVPYIPGGYSSTTYVSEGSAASEPAADAPPPAADPMPLPAVSEDGTQWMPVGVFALKPTSDADATRVVHLFVNKEGAVRGSHFDLMSEDVQTVQGNVNKTSLVATWTVGKGQSAVFEAPLAELTKPEGTVTVRFAEGKTATWKAVRVTK